MAVVAALELNHLGTSRVATGQAHGAHRGFRAGVNHAHHVHARTVDDQLRELPLGLARGAEAEAVLGSLFHCLHYGGVGVAEQHRPPRANEVNVVIPVHVGEVGALCLGDKTRLATNGTKPAHRRVHATGDDVFGGREKLGRPRDIIRCDGYRSGRTHGLIVRLRVSLLH